MAQSTTQNSQTTAPDAKSSSPVQTALSIDDALQKAAAYSRSAQLKASQFRASQAAFREAESSLWPNLSVNASASYLTNPPKGIKLKAGELGYVLGSNPPDPNYELELAKDAKETYFKGGFDLQWPIFTSGKIINSILLAESQMRESSLSVQQDKQQTIRDLRKSYFGAKLAKQTADILNEMEALVTSNAKDMRSNFGQGMATREDVLSAESKQAGIRFQRIKAEQSYQTALEGLSLLTGVDPDEVNDLPSEYRTAVPVLNKNDLAAKALASSPNRAMMQEHLTQAARALDIENGNGPFRPNLAFNMHFETSGQTPPSTTDDTWDDDWSYNLTFTLGLQMNLFDGFKQFERSNQATERLQQAGIGLDLNDKALRLQVQQLIENLTTAGAAVEDKKAALELSTEREKNAKVAYENDLATRDEYQSAQLGTLAAKLDYVLSCYQVESGFSELELVSGQSF